MPVSNSTLDRNAANNRKWSAYDGDVVVRPTDLSVDHRASAQRNLDLIPDHIRNIWRLDKMERQKQTERDAFVLAPLAAAGRPLSALEEVADVVTWPFKILKDLVDAGVHTVAARFEKREP